MKKIIFALASILAFSTLAAAGTGIPSGGTFTFKQSNNVGMDYYVDTTKQNYVANSKHTAGNRLYSSSNATSNVWFKEDTTTIGKPIADVTTMTTPGESTYSGWSSQ